MLTKTLGYQGMVPALLCVSLLWDSPFLQQLSAGLCAGVEFLKDVVAPAIQWERPGEMGLW